MTVNDLCKMAGITRQWLNKRVDLGKVPGCHRKPSGRLAIDECPELHKWAKTCSALQKKKQGKRLTLQQRLDRLNDSPIAESFTAAELGRKIGLTASTINRRVEEIPGAYFDGKRFLFQNTPELKHWIEGGIAARHLEMEKIRRQQVRFPNNEFLRAGGSINRAFVAMVRLMRYNPPNSWDTEQLRFFQRDLLGFSRFAESIDKEIARRKTQSKLVAGSPD
jgi:hypothetical protein